MASNVHNAFDDGRDFLASGHEPLMIDDARRSGGQALLALRALARPLAGWLAVEVEARLAVKAFRVELQLLHLLPMPRTIFFAAAKHRIFCHIASSHIIDTTR